jgi:hypothetical protein
VTVAEAFSEKRLKKVLVFGFEANGVRVEGVEAGWTASDGCSGAGATVVVVV